MILVFSFLFFALIVLVIVITVTYHQLRWALMASVYRPGRKWRFGCWSTMKKPYSAWTGAICSLENLILRKDWWREDVNLFNTNLAVLIHTTGYDLTSLSLFS